MNAPGQAPSDRVALVTGAARGVGRGIALALGDAGYLVHVADRETRDRRTSPLPGTVEDTVEQIEGRGGQAVAVPMDVSDDLEVVAAFEHVRERHAGLDVLVANAGDGNALPFASAPFWELPWEYWTLMVDSGLRGQASCAWHAASLLLERRGVAVLTGFVDRERPDDVLGGHLFYDLAMRGTSRLATALHADLAPRGAAALALSPGFTRTEAIEAVVPAEVLAHADPLERPGAALVALLAGDGVREHGGRTVTVAEVAESYGL